MKEINLHCIKRNGERLRVIKQDKPIYTTYLENIPNGSYLLTIKPDKNNKRSLLQNNYYYGVVVCIVQQALMEYWGEKLPINATKTYVHEFLKNKFLFYEIVNENTGEVERFQRSTTDLSKTEFLEYIEQIRLWTLSTFNIDIPQPNEELELNL